MLDVAPSEFLMVAFVALVVIGPKDLPKAMRVVGHWVGRARGVARQFRSGFDAIVREAELEEMEKRWAAENERIMREHGAGSTSVDPEPEGETARPVSSDAGSSDVTGQPDATSIQPVDHEAGQTVPAPSRLTEPKHVETPQVVPSVDDGRQTPRGDGVTS